MELSKRIETIRQELKISKTEIAEKLNMDLANYARLEKQGDRLKYFQICDIALALGVSVEYLLFGEEKINESKNIEIKDLKEKIRLLELQLEVCEMSKELIKYERVDRHEIFLGCLSKFIEEKKAFEEIKKAFYEIMNYPMNNEKMQTYLSISDFKPLEIKTKWTPEQNNPTPKE
jgi:transcriptional regulator with XRE-family HTH domain